ncbi:MAG: response regulator transcription factor [Proteobacteria bacterium]|nr:response regulator transcription factor [Pseudomonadota bacterium]
MIPQSRILVVDDEPQLLRVLRPTLATAGYDVTTAETGASAITTSAASQFDLLLLDLGLPDMDGKDVISRVREWSDVPILVLSARDIEAEKIEALDRGADDYVNKPFAMGELMARIRAALRGRQRRYSTQGRFKAAELEIDFSTRRVSVFGEEVRLTRREYDLLRTMALHAGKVVTHKQLIAAVWGPQASVEAQFVRVLVGQVRQKIEEDSSVPRLLLTEAGLGYRLRSEDEE